MSTKLGTLTLDLVARIGSFTQGMRNASNSAEREMTRVQNSVVTVDGLFKKLAVTAGAMFSVSQVSGYADSYINLQNRLKLVTNSQQELSQAMNDTYKVSQTTAQSWDSTVQVYQRFAQNAKALGINLVDAARLTETVSKAVAVSGATAESAEAALMQFGQALSSGVLRGDEFRSISEQAGGLRDAIATGLKLSVGELRDWAYAGKLTTNVVIKALQDAGVSVDELFNKTDFNGAQGWTLIKDAAVKTVGEFSKATGATKALFESLKAISENMGGITTTLAVGAAFMAGTYIPTMLAMVKVGYTKTAQLVEQTAIQYAAIQAERAAAGSALAQAEAQMVNTQSTLASLAAEKALEVQRLSAQINAAGRMASTTRMAQLRQIEVQVTAELVAAETALANARARSAVAGVASVGVGGKLLGILGGPVGMGVTLAAVAAGYLMMKGDAEKATSSIEYQGQKLEDLVVKYRELNTLQRDNETKALADQLDELSLKFKVAASDLSSFIGALPASNEKIAFFEKLTREFQNGKISSDAYYESVKNANFLSDKQLEKVRGLIAGHNESKQALDGAKKAQEALSLSTGKTTGEIKNQAVGVAQLSEELKKLLSTNADSAYKSKYLNEVVKRNVDPKLGEMLYEARKAEGLLGTGKALSEETRKSVLNRWNAEKGLNKTLEDRTKAEEKSKKLIEAQGAAMKVNARVTANAANYNFASIESKNKLPAGLLSAIHMQESRGNANAYNKSSGATGGFQFLKGTADQYGVKNRNDLAQSAEGAGKYMAYLLKLFKGDLDKAVSAYHAGEGNVQRGTNIGPVNRQYVKNIKGYMGGASGVSFTEDYSYDDYIKEQEQLAIEREKQAKEQAEKQKEIQVRYYNDWQNLEADNQEKIKDIQESFANDPAERDRLIELQAKAYEVDVGNWFKAQDEKVAAEREANKQILAERYDLINASLAMQGQIKGLSSGAEDINARASMSPQAYAEWSLGNNRSNAQLDLKNQRVGVEQDIMTSDLYSNDDDRYEALLEAHQAYRDGLAAIDVEYDQQVKDLALSQSQTQMDIWQDLLTRTGTIFSSMAEMVKNTAGESSAAYKVMFLTNQGISMAQAMINTEVAATKAMAEGGYVMGIPMATAIRGLGYASVGMIAAQTISGMAHDGIDNIPKEGTWLLDKGERVVDSRTNGDLKDYLAKGGGSGGNVTINQSINIASDGTATTQNDSKQLGALINNAVLAVIRKEQRQGGLLSK